MRNIESSRKYSICWNGNFKLINYLTNMWFLVVLFRHNLYYFWKCWKNFKIKKKKKFAKGNIESSRKYSSCWNENLKK
jgi:hypothetical protein